MKGCCILSQQQNFFTKIFFNIMLARARKIFGARALQHFEILVEKTPKTLFSSIFCCKFRSVGVRRTNMMLKKNSVKKFCCYDKMQQPLIISFTRKFVVFCCCNKKMLPKNFSTTQKKIWSDIFSQKLSLALGYAKKHPSVFEGGKSGEDLWICIICLR